MRWFLVTLLISVLSASLLTTTAQGRYGNTLSPDQAKSARDKGDIVSLSTIFKNLKRRYGGFQLDANLYNENGRPVYVIDWQTGKGERVQLRVDARTGRVVA